MAKIPDSVIEIETAKLRELLNKVETALVRKNYTVAASIPCTGRRSCDSHGLRRLYFAKLDGLWRLTVCTEASETVLRDCSLEIMTHVVPLLPDLVSALEQQHTQSLSELNKAISTVSSFLETLVPPER